MVYNFIKSINNDKRNFIINDYYLIYLDEEEIYNNPNLHSEEQDELEIPNGKV